MPRARRLAFAAAEHVVEQDAADAPLPHFVAGNSVVVEYCDSDDCEKRQRDDGGVARDEIRRRAQVSGGREKSERSHIVRVRPRVWAVRLRARPYPIKTMWTSPGPWTPVTILYSMSAVRLGPVIRFM